ncbi:MAG: response regulator [Desulfatibacillaceae bacterium]
MDRKEKIRRQLLVTFQAELEEHLATLNRDLMALEEGRDQQQRAALVSELFRAAHSVKGASRAVGIREIEVVAHRVEDVLGAIQRDELALVPELFDLLFPAVDALGEAMAASQEGRAVDKDHQEELLAGLDAALRGEKVAGFSGAKKRPVDKATRSAGQKPGKSGAPKKEAAPPLPDLEEDDELPSWDPATPEFPTPDDELPSWDEPAVEAEGEPWAAFAPGKKKTSAEKWRRRRTSAEKPPAGTGEEGESMARAAEIAQSARGAGGAPGEKTIRVTTDKLDTLMARMGELVVARMRTTRRLDQMEELQQRMIRWQKSWRQMRNVYKHIQQNQERYSEIEALVQFLAENEEHLNQMDHGVSELHNSFAQDCDRLALITDELQDSVRRVRMLPVATVFDLYPRMVRDLARDKGKEVRLLIEGEETEVDRQVLDAMKDPLTHIIRNALDHGIDFPEDREAQDKPRRGTIRLKAAQQGGTIILEVSDDGKGIDTEKLKQVAVDRGVITAREAASLGRHDAMDLIFRSGLSTQSEITDISGRGVGLDVVRENIKQLQGLIQVNTEIGRGTTFTLTLPLTLATSQVLMVKVDGETVAVPTIAVDRILQIEPKRLGSIEGKPAVVVDGRPVPLISLGRVLELSSDGDTVVEGQKISIIVLGVAEKRLAFRVEGLRDTQEVVIKNMGRQLSRVRYVAGATILGSGDVVIILNVSDLVKAAHETVGITTVSAAPAKAEIQRKNRVLVVDDSITTRTLEKNILESAGYQVLVAADGEEAWSLLQSDHPDVVVSDVDMPRLNGFGLTEKVKADDRTRDIPVVLVTSLESPKDKLKGMEAGAEAYIVKGSFDQSELLETIERLIG